MLTLNFNFRTQKYKEILKQGVKKLTMVLENQQLGVKNVAFLTPN